MSAFAPKPTLTVADPNPRGQFAVKGSVTLEEIGDLSLKRLSRAVAVYNAVQ